ncbi:Predicted ester cyclase [Serratia grimesii]|uniref:nuclear transport factor 2 family protein n=1 Tax=Serratia grimesii TaxID=82995 RepID=UPI00217865A5|nr:nuclear transport factor 2 family protein [Serratia grimesii]CAI1748541.1 Predicted ester cyclase [Serratia grimesii]
MKSIIKGCVVGLLLVAGVAQAGNTPKEVQNKNNVLEFYQQGLNNKDFAAAQPYLGDEYKQHNPNAQDGVEGFRKFVELLKTRFPRSHSAIKQVFVDGNYVILHVETSGREKGKTAAIIDIFRLNDAGKIVEHWDVTQPVPEKTASGNSMF